MTAGRRKTEKDKQDPDPQPDFNPAWSDPTQQAGAVQPQHSRVFSCEPSIGGGALFDGQILHCMREESEGQWGDYSKPITTYLALTPCMAGATAMCPVGRTGGEWRESRPLAAGLREQLK